MQHVTIREPRPTMAYALGAAALGAIALGALAIGFVAVRKLDVTRARIRQLEVDNLLVRLYSSKALGGKAAEGDESSPWERHQEALG